MRKYKKIEQILRESKNLESYIKSDLPYELIRGVVEMEKTFNAEKQFSKDIQSKEEGRRWLM